MAIAAVATAVFTVGLVSAGVRTGLVASEETGSTQAATETPAPAVPAQAAPRLSDWPDRAAEAIDGRTLASAGIGVPEGANVFAARIFSGGASPAYQLYEAGGGAFTESFYPASTIKVFAALGALDFAASLGFTGEATVDGGFTLRQLYDAAIRSSSNEDYDDLVRIAGVDRLNAEFLPVNGYQNTVIQESLSGSDVWYSPPMVLAEDGREVEVPERTAQGLYRCDGANCSSLFDLGDVVRRVVLDRELPEEERFRLAPADMAALQDALLGAEAWITPGIEDAVGPGARVYSKPGYVGGLDCVDDAVVTVPSGSRYLIALSVPDYDGCEVLAALAHDVLRVLGRQDAGSALRTDGSVVAIADGHQIGS